MVPSSGQQNFFKYSIHTFPRKCVFVCFHIILCRFVVFNRGKNRFHAAQIIDLEKHFRHERYLKKHHVPEKENLQDLKLQFHLNVHAQLSPKHLATWLDERLMLWPVTEVAR